MVVDIQVSPAFSVGRPRFLFEGNFAEGPFAAGYDVSPDGQRFLLARGRSKPGGGEVNVILNWFEELKRSVPLK
jgi:hypothetical protein